MTGSPGAPLALHRPAGYRGAESTAPPRSALVLVATHDEHLARMLETCLSPHGFAVACAATGQAALAIARRRAPGAVIMDVALPGVSAASLCRALRDDAEPGRCVPIVVVSDLPLTRDARRRLCEAGAWLVAGAPLDLPSLLAQVVTFVAAMRQSEERARAGVFEPASGHYSALGLARRAREVSADAARRGAPVAGVALAARPDGGADAAAPSRAASARLAELLHRRGRATDVIARVSEHEFRLLAPATDGAGARRLIERLRHAAWSAHDPDGEPVVVLGGYSASDQRADASPDAVGLLREATAALRLAAPSAEPIRAFADAPRR